MNPNSLNILVPISFVFGVVFMVSFSQYLSYRNRKRTLIVIGEALKASVEIDHKSLEAIAWARPRVYADLRRGCLFLAFAMGIFAISIKAGNADLRSILGVGAILPTILGLTYLFFHFRLPSKAPPQ